LAGGGIGFEFEVNEDGDVVFVLVGPFFEGLQTADEGVAHRVWVEICYMENLDARLLENSSVERFGGVGEIGECPYGGWVIQAAFFVRVQIELERADGLVLELNGELGVRVVIVLGRGNVFFEYGTLSPRDFAMVGVVSSDDLDAIDEY
jgi:hypothetical protein